MAEERRDRKGEVRLDCDGQGGWHEEIERAVGAIQGLGFQSEKASVN